MRLTVNHLRRAPQITNAMLQREVDLRGLGLSSLDEGALTLLNNEFDVLNLTSNALTALEYFPVTGAGRMERLVTLIVHRNQIQKVSTGSCSQVLSNVRHFMADRNNLRCVRDLLFLKQWKQLEVLSLEGNPVCDANPEGFDTARLRAFLVHLCPSLKLINYARVKDEDRAGAEALRKEFKALVAQWEGIATTVAADGRRIRKRGREGRAIGADRVPLPEPVPMPTPAVAATATTTTAGPSAAVQGNEEAPAQNGTASVSAPAPPLAAPIPTEEKASSDNDLQTRLNQLEERILAEDITPEEMEALEREMNELTAEQERRKRPRR